MKDFIRVKIIRGRYYWVCSCGRGGKRGYGYVGLAESYGNVHVSAKHSN